MKLHEEIYYDDETVDITTVTRVPGGWVYGMKNWSDNPESNNDHSLNHVFVPFNHEFLGDSK
jgi:hypothetical protein